MARPSSRLERLWFFVKERPYATAIVVVFTVAGAVLATWFQVGSADMSPVSRVLGGAIAGACFALFPLGTRLLD